MHDDHSLQLFSKHAFKMDYPQDGYAMLSQEFVKLGGGLPLALKVIGSLLFDRHTKFWEEKLIELKKVPCTSNKVQETLKLSYNELSHTEKQIFLDISCIFVGEDKERPFYMWADCEFYPESGIKTLILRSLLKIDEVNCFWMHDHIRDLGRTIVAEEDIENPFNRSRIWSNYDAVNMLKHKKGTNRVEIMRVYVKDVYKLTNEEFGNLSGLRYLELTCRSLAGKFSEILPNLRWFRLNYPGPIPTNINLKKCIILELNWSRITDDWEGWKELKVAGKLKVLRLTACKNLEKAPDLSSCRDLEDLQLVYCEKMKGHLDIGNLKKLKKLVLLDNYITELRGDIGLLQNLEDIVLKDLCLREAPPRIGKLSTLVSLAMRGRVCKMEIREDLPTSLKKLSISCPTVPNLLELQQLEVLQFDGCTDKPQIPGNLWKLPKLKTLVILGCSSEHFTTLLQVPASQSGLPHPVLPSSLKKLNVFFCEHLQTLPNLANLSYLTALHLKGVIIWEIPGLGELQMLATLQLQQVPNLEHLDGLEDLVMLTELRVGRCGVLGKLPDLSNLIKLNTLEISECRLLTGIQGLSRSLKILQVSDCPYLSNVEGLESLESLQVLELDRSGMSAEWLAPSLSKFGKMELLSYGEDESLPDHMSVKELPHLPKSIRFLAIRCNGLEVITGLDHMESLEWLEMRDCKSIRKLSAVSGLSNLMILDVSGCLQLSEVRGLGGLVLLTQLRMCGCISVKEVDLSGLKNLQAFVAEGCTRLRKLNGLEELKSLELLVIDKRLKYKVLSSKSAAWKRLTRLLGL
ncbi:Disease resistance protein L6 [Linum grandiflorum]